MKKKHLIVGLSLAALAFSSCEKTEQLTKGSATADRQKAVNGTIVDATWTNYFRRTSGWTAGDATLSIPVTYNSTTSFTHNIWLFGDSHLDGINTVNEPDTRNCMFDINNCMMRQSGYGNSFTTVISSGSGPLRTTFRFPENNSNSYNGNRLWPHHGFEHNNKVTAFFGSYDNGMGFQGNYLAEFNYDITSSSGVTMTKLTPLDAGGIAWGMWVLAEGNYVYIYGTKRYETVFNTSAAYVAKVLKTKIKSTVAGDWKFWNGSAWVNSPTSAAPIKTGLSNHLSVVKFLNTSGQARYAIINQEVNLGSCNAGTKIYSYGLASAPTGPFNTQKVLYTITDKLPGAPAGSNTMLTYDAQAHPEHAAYGLLLISYNVNGNCTGTCNPWTLQVPADGYRPKFIRSDIKDIDASLASVVQTW